jgi:esterase/lipase superfamily enzyme
MFGYIGDMDKAEQAEPFLQSFMKLLMRDADIDAVDILVHSMGSQPALRALSALRSVFETERQGMARQQAIRIGQIMFAAPDVAMPVFDQKIRRIAPYADRVTVYASMTDAALLASKVLRSGAGRVGQLDPDTKEPLLVEVENVHVIDATGKENWWRLDRIMSGYGHDYFLQSPGVLADIQKILRSIGTDDKKTPKQRSPEWFEEERFRENSKWPFWRLKENQAVAVAADGRQ